MSATEPRPRGGREASVDVAEVDPEARAGAGEDPPFVLPDSVEYRADVLFARHNGVDLYLDLLLPRESGTARRAVLYIHGGGWRGGNRRRFRRQAAHMATLGCVGAMVQYRFAPEFVFPAAVDDVQAAVRWLRQHAGRLGISPRRIGTVGASAGAHLAAMLGTTDVPVDGVSSRVQAVVAINGPFDFLAFLSPAMEAFIGGDRTKAARASPLHLADGQAAPTLLLHGTGDRVVPYDQSVAFQRRLRELDVRAELYTEPSAPHSFFGRTPYYQRALAEMERFLLDAL